MIRDGTNLKSIPGLQSMPGGSPVAAIGLQGCSAFYSTFEKSSSSASCIIVIKSKSEPLTRCVSMKLARAMLNSCDAADSTCLTLLTSYVAVQTQMPVSMTVSWSHGC